MEALQTIWTNFDNEIVSFIFSICTALILWVFRGKVRLIWGQANKSWHSVPVQEGDLSIINEKYFAQNLGTSPANNVEIVYNGKPTKLMIFPQRDYKTNTNPDGAHIVTIPYISPKELITLDAIYIGENQGNILSVKCKEQEGKQVPFFVVRKFSMNVYRTIWALIILGMTFLVSLILKAIGI